MASSTFGCSYLARRPESVGEYSLKSIASLVPSVKCKTVSDLWQCCLNRCQFSLPSIRQRGTCGIELTFTKTASSPPGSPLALNLQSVPVPNVVPSHRLHSSLIVSLSFMALTPLPYAAIENSIPPTGLLRFGREFRHRSRSQENNLPVQPLGKSRPAAELRSPSVRRIHLRLQRRFSTTPDSRIIRRLLAQRAPA